MFCEKCGQEVGEESNFCKKCGNLLNAEKAEYITNPKKEFNFWLTYIKVFSVTAIFFLILVGIAGEFKNGTEEALLGSLFLSALVGIIIVIIIKNSKRKSSEGVENKLTPEDIKKYKGLEGWLTLVILGTFITLGYSGYNFINTLLASDEYGDSTLLFAYDFLSSGIIISLSAYVIYLFFKKKKTFPKYYISLLIVLMVINITTFIIVASYSSVGEDFQEYANNAGRSVLGAIIWGLYATKSKRVAATFVE